MLEANIRPKMDLNSKFQYCKIISIEKLFGHHLKTNIHSNNKIIQEYLL